LRLRGLCREDDQRRLEVIEGDLKTLGLRKDDILDSERWRRPIFGGDLNGQDNEDNDEMEPFDHGLPGVTPGLYPNTDMLNMADLFD